MVPVMAPVKQTVSVLNLLRERMVSLEGYTGLILIYIFLKTIKIVGSWKENEVAGFIVFSQ